MHFAKPAVLFSNSTRCQEVTEEVNHGSPAGNCACEEVGIVVVVATGVDEDVVGAEDELVDKVVLAAVDIVVGAVDELVVVVLTHIKVVMLHANPVGQLTSLQPPVLVVVP
ncbi:hypothetical protein Y032_0004g1754 [Ancylostoma ceylanicum]|nr:hypothetical protein Y032_0004g1754 [Ancylostoma ceylanicum]